ncbi:T-cell-specific surface glycoprotein CD28-like [Thamnophis elegans]|uniref:T-cell-specific surface glycoprotein CD28-like n=1 Tax=Thamnophis elegans TaxID=35005 RepID=UPI001376966B|nr:T-cell-specific surface glycoprotein CD28-like [Thamnophis elegans]
MKIGIVAFCLLCYCFEASHGACQCLSISSCTRTCTEDTTNHSWIKDEFPKENFTLNCPLPSNVKGFYMTLYKGQRNQKVCSLYVDNGKNNSERTNEFCEPIHSDENVSFVLRNLKSRDSDTYTCCLEVLTPVYRCCKSNETHLYVQDSENSEDSEKSCWLSELTSRILIGLVVFLFVACIFSSIRCFRSSVCQCANTYDNNTDYMSMAAVKPR